MLSRWTSNDLYYGVGHNRRCADASSRLGEQSFRRGCGERRAVYCTGCQFCSATQGDCRWPTRLVVGVTGGHGFLFGRGNQQISSEVIAKVGRDQIDILATRTKLGSLANQWLEVDTGDASLDRRLQGSIRCAAAMRTSCWFKWAAGDSDEKMCLSAV